MVHCVLVQHQLHTRSKNDTSNNINVSIHLIPAENISSKRSESSGRRFPPGLVDLSVFRDQIRDILVTHVLTFTTKCSLPHFRAS